MRPKNLLRKILRVAQDDKFYELYNKEELV